MEGFPEHTAAQEQAELWSTMVNPPNTPKGHSETAECPITHQKEAGDDNPPQMTKRHMWQLVGPDSSHLPIAISCDNEIEAWTRIYPGNVASDNNSNDYIYTLLNMFKYKTNAENIEVAKEEKHMTKNDSSNIARQEDIHSATHDQGQGTDLPQETVTQVWHVVENDRKETPAEEAKNVSRDKPKVKSHVHEETNTDFTSKKDKNCQLQDYIQQVDIYSDIRSTKPSSLPVRKKVLSMSNTMSVTSVTSRPGVASKSSLTGKPIDDYRQASPDPAISRTGLFSATPTSMMRPTDTFINRSKCRINKLKRENSISETEDLMM